MTFSSRMALVLLASLAGACSQHEPGISLSVTLQPFRIGIGDAGADDATLFTDLGYHVSLEHAYVVISRVELLACENGSRTALPSLNDLLSPVSRARAHGMGSPTALAVPHVVDLLATAARDSMLGRLAPPPGDYCSVRIAVEAADADAVGLPVAVDIVGRSLDLAGRFTADGVEEHEFRYRDERGAWRELPLLDGRGQETVLRLSAQQRSAQLHLAISPRSLLDGVPMQSIDHEQAASIAVDNVLASASAQALVDDE